MYGKQLFLLANVLVAILSSGQSMRIHGIPPQGKPAPRRTIAAPTISNSTWVHPSMIAKDCLNSVGKSLVDKCQQKAEQDYDPARINTSTSTVWETCCSLYEELDCYLGNAKDFCPDSTRKALVNYTRKVVISFQDTLCHTVIQIGWKSYCDRMIHESMANHTKKNPSPATPDMIKLPTPIGPEKKCFEKLRQSPSGNLEQKCMNESLTKWDPKRDKLFDGNVHDSCCAYYKAMDCIIAKSSNVCDNSTDAASMAAYKTKSLQTLSNTLCKKVPSDNAHRLCSASGAAFASVPSIAVLFTVVATLIFRNVSL